MRVSTAPSSESADESDNDPNQFGDYNSSVGIRRQVLPLLDGPPRLRWREEIWTAPITIRASASATAAECGRSLRLLLSADPAENAWLLDKAAMTACTP